LRTLHDAQGLREELQPGKKLVVIGAGFIGLEAAATAVARGCTVTVLEGLPAPLIRGLGEDMGTAATAIHATQGVNIRCNVRVQSIETQAGSVTGVRISDATGESVVAADVVLVGIGVAPATQWLEGSGLVVNDGVVCDAHLQAAPGVFAAGDVARWVNGLYSDLEPTMRVEHWTTAAEQGAHAARNALAHINNTPLVPYSAVPFFWSDQFTARIQFLGRSTDAEEIRVVAGSVDEGKFAAAYMRAGRLVGVLGVSMPKVVMPSRKLLEVHTPWEVALEHYAGLAS
jgi:NADPH-dependent 2,4-dienoyl-CoA reductase/sulfur reductase-like enzyme